MRKEFIPQALEELAKYKDIESRLGIDLIIGGTALLNGIYTKDYGYIKGSLLSLEKYRINIPSRSVSLPFAGPVGYGKTWVLTKEELKCD